MGRDRALARHLASRGGLPGLTLEVLSVSLLGWLVTCDWLPTDIGKLVIERQRANGKKGVSI